MKQPVDHILRGRLPWRTEFDGAVTECGYDASKVSVITRDAYIARLKDLGQQRTAMVTCMTCSSTVRRWDTWETDPRKALGREIEWECGWGVRTKHGEQLKDELLAIADLIESHRSEFDALLAKIKGRREWNAKKVAMGVKPRAVERKL
jgi:hypothetical protein